MNPQIEAEATAVTLDILNENAFRVPIVPSVETWRAFAHLKMRRRLSPHGHVTRSEEVFIASMEAMSVHPAFRSAAEREIVNIETAFRGVEIAALEAELKAIDPAVWGLSDAEQRKALQVGGLAAVPVGVDRAVFDHAREKAALELMTGTLALTNFLQDVRRMKELQTKLATLKAELAALSTTAEREQAERKRKVNEAKRERSQLRRREPEAVTA